jgi:hypothetical protein
MVARRPVDLPLLLPLALLVLHTRVASASCCANTCKHAHDGICDDGGAGSVFHTVWLRSSVHDTEPRRTLACPYRLM